MNVKFRSVPFFMAATACAVLAATTWKSWALKSQNDRLRESLLSARLNAGPATARSTQGAGDATADSGPKSAPTASATVSSPFAEEQAALTRARERVDRAAALLGVKPDDEVKSLGRIETVAGEAVEFIAKFTAFAESLHSPAETNAEVEKAMSTYILDWLPKSEIISGLEAQPAKIGKFHAAALKDALTLDAATTARLQPIIQAEFETLGSRQLTRPQRPETEQAEWYKNREAALKESAARIEAVIPASQRKPFVVEQVLHLGTGMKAETQMNPDHSGHGSVSMGFYFPGMGTKDINLQK